jgi:precorrin-2 dehydrogenase/sirohydrochlorin ferrochelatase
MHYPLFLDLRHRKCLILGGGAVAERKALTLLKAHATVTVLSLEFSDGLRRLAKRYRKLALIKLTPSVSARRRAFGAGVERKRRAKGRLALNGRIWKDASLAFACTSDRKVNTEFVRMAKRRGVWVNQADDPDASDFLVPASFREGKLQVALSTSGLSPLFARQLKTKIQKAIGKDDVRFLNWLGRQGKRQRVIRQLATSEERKRFFAALLEPKFLRLFRRPEMTRIEAHFQRLLTRFQSKGQDRA